MKKPATNTTNKKVVEPPKVSRQVRRRREILAAKLVRSEMKQSVRNPAIVPSWRSFL